MTDQLLVTELAAVLLLDDALTALIPDIFATNTGENASRPLLTISIGELQAASGGVRFGNLRFELRSRLGDENPETPELNHEARFAALQTALFDDPDALRAAVTARGQVQLAYHKAPNLTPPETAVEGEDLRTTLIVAAVWQFLA